MVGGSDLESWAGGSVGACSADIRNASSTGRRDGVRGIRDFMASALPRYVITYI